MDSSVRDEIPFLTTVWKTTIRQALMQPFSDLPPSLVESILTHLTSRIRWTSTLLSSSLQSSTPPSGFPKFFLSLYLVLARSQQSALLPLPSFAPFLDALFQLGDCSLPELWIGLSPSQADQLRETAQKIVENCVQSIVRLAVQQQQADRLLSLLASSSSSSSSSPFTRLSMLLSLQQAANNVSLSVLLESAHDAAYSLRLTNPQPFIESVNRSVQTMTPSQRADALHQLCVAAIEGDEAMCGVMSSVLQTWMANEKLEYKAHIETPLSVDENSRGFLEFLVEYSILLIAAQLKANVEASEIVSLSSVFGDCLQHLSIDSQNKWIHFLLQQWSSSNPLLSDCFGFVLAGIRWPSLKCLILSVRFIL